MIFRLAIPKTLLVALVCVYALVFGLLAARAYLAHETNALDLGNYDQAVWNAAHGQGLRLTLAPEFGPTRFAVHVEPILFLIAPIYRLISDDPRVLLWLQAIVIALGGLPIYGLARRRLGSDWSALIITAAYYLLPAVESVTLFEFHAVGLAPTLLLTALYFLDRALAREDDPRGLWTGQVIPTSGYHKTPPGSTARRADWWLSGLCLLLALGTKEDISLHIVMIGLYLSVLRRRWLPGLVLVASGLAWFYIAFYVVIPNSRPTGAGSAYTGFFAPLGDTPFEIILSPFRTPGKVAALLARPGSLRALGMLTLPLALMPLMGLPLFLLSAPTLSITMLSSNPLMQQLETFHYAAPALPFMVLAAIDGIARLSNWHFKGLPESDRNSLDSAGQVKGQRRPGIPLAIFFSPYSLSLLVLLVSLVYHYYRGYSPLARSFHWPRVTAHERLGRELAASIPAEAAVIAQAELVPLLSHRPWIQIWQGPFDQRADYFFLDVSHPAFVNRDGAQESLLSDMAQDPDVGPIATTDGFVLLQKGAPRQPTRPEFFTFAYGDPPTSATPVAATFGDELQLVAFETLRNYADREAEPLVVLYWRTLAPLEEDYFIALFLLDEAGEPVGATFYQQPLTVWWPTSRWEAGRTVRLLANTFPWWSGDRGRFGYGVAVVREDVTGGSAEAEDRAVGRLSRPWQVASRLRVTREDGGPAPLDNGTLLPLTGFRRLAGIPYAVPFGD